MSVSMLDISENFIKGYVKAPPSLQDKTITTLAIRLCQNIELKKDIIFESEPLKLHKYSILNSTWEILIVNRSTAICEQLPLPPALKNMLVGRIRLIALQLFSWNRQQVEFSLSPLFADSLLIHSDWTVEMRLDEKKITKRLIRDERISVYQRYRMACFYCFHMHIYQLWDQLSSKQREDIFRVEKCVLVLVWSHRMVGTERKVIRNRNFWEGLMLRGIDEGSRLTVLYCWDKLDEGLRQNDIQYALEVEDNIKIRKLRKEITGDFLPYFNELSSLIPYMDILCFLLTQMSKKRRVRFFQNVLSDIEQNLLVCFLQWPYLDLLIPLIEELWNILPKSKYGDILLTLANHYSNENDHKTKRSDYMDYRYGYVMVELLEKTPDNFKRYSDNYLPSTENVVGKILLALINKKPLKIRNVKIFQHILQHVTPKQIRSFFESEYGESFCCHLGLEEHLELLNSMLMEYLPENDIGRFKKKILISKSGKDSCFQMLTQVNGDCLNSWLNWGFSSQQEISQFILNIFFKDQRIDFTKVSDFKYVIDIDCLDKLIEMYAPSKDAARKFKSRFVKVYSRDVCISFVIHSKLHEVDRFLAWGFTSEDTRERFRKWFIKKYAMYLCEYHIANSNLQVLELFLIWCFPTVEVIEQFKKDLFFSSGLNFPWVLLSRNSQDLDSLIKWFRLSPEALVKFKREVMFCSNTLSSIFDPLVLHQKYLVKRKSYVDEMLRRDARLLRWGLTDEETVMAFKKESANYLMSLTFTYAIVPRWALQKWNNLMKEIFPYISIEPEQEINPSTEWEREINRPMQPSPQSIERDRLIKLIAMYRQSIRRDQAITQCVLVVGIVASIFVAVTAYLN